MPEAELDHSEWQPVPLELPLELPVLQTPPRAPDPDPDAEVPRARVIVIDLA
jgi:hypothetical protein